MKSSKNPKVLNYIVRNALNPILKKIEQLKQKEVEHDGFIDNAYKKANENRNSITEKEAEYIGHENTTRELVVENNEKLSYLIKTKLYDPNLKNTDDDDSGNPIIPDNYIKNKAIASLSYGFVKSNVSYILAGIINHGIAIERETEIQNEFEFINPNNNKFPSFYPNDILKLSTGSAFIATNNGLVEYDLGTQKYFLRTTSYGLNANMVKRIIPVFNKIGEKSGYIAGTSKGISFSPNGARWINVDKSFINTITNFHVTEHLNTVYDKIFIGTIRGIYFIDIARFIEDDSLKVIYLEGITDVSPSNYINSIALDSTNDRLYIATDNGILLVNDITSYIAKKDYKAHPASYKTFNSHDGLSSTLCHDITIMPSLKLCIATANGITITTDFKQFSYITKKTDLVTTGLESYMCSRIIRKTGNAITILHPIGFTEGLII
jgi:hypothetical protein